MGELKALEKPPLRGQEGLAIFEKNAAASSLLGLQKPSPVSCERPPLPALVRWDFSRELPGSAQGNSVTLRERAPMA